MKLLLVIICVLSLPFPIFAQGITIDSVMTPQEQRAAGISRLTPAEKINLNKWLNSYTLKVATIVTQKQPTKVLPNRTADPLDILEGARIVADDGTFLGLVSRNDLDRKSIANNIGKNGSDISSTSIFNDIGRYGGTISQMSPFNSISSRPPKLFLTNGKWIYLTTNTIKSPRVDPHALVGWLKAK